MRTWLNWTGLLVVTVFVMMVCGLTAQSEAQSARNVVLVYGDQTNAAAFATLLRAGGLVCELRDQASLDEKWTSKADLIVLLACCQGGYLQKFKWHVPALDGLGNARILACGDVGAAVLQTKQLLIAHPYGWHNMCGEKTVIVPQKVLAGPLGQALKQPYDLTGNSKGDVAIQIHSFTGRLEHIGISDGGQFPDGTLGIGRESTDLHHWIICQQGNYTLWGADSRADDLTEQGQRLFVNLCHYLAHAEPQKLVFPAPVYIHDGANEGELKGGARDMFRYAVKRTGTVVIRLEWKSDAVLTMLTHGMFWRRVDGRSPLTIKLAMGAAELNKEFDVEVTSFQLPEGGRCPYRLKLAWQ